MFRKLILWIFFIAHCDFIFATSFIQKKGIKLAVFGTLGSLIKVDRMKLLKDCFLSEGVKISPGELEMWCGACEKEVVVHHCFMKNIEEKSPKILRSYYKKLEQSNCSLTCPSVVDIIESLKSGGIKVILTTYSPSFVQEAMLSQVGLKELADDYISEYDLKDNLNPGLIKSISQQHGVNSLGEIALFSCNRDRIKQGVMGQYGFIAGVGDSFENKKDLEYAGATRTYDSLEGLRHLTDRTL